MRLARRGRAELAAAPRAHRLAVEPEPPQQPEPEPETPEPPKPQVVPDAHPGATHIHDTPYEPEVHEIMHFHADATAPAHIPMGLISSQIQEAGKVV